eukprot:XP_015575769.1 arogenate dehydrogenase 1, chloroplastic isoform X1 [Ricinus communis]
MNNRWISKYVSPNIFSRLLFLVTKGSFEINSKPEHFPLISSHAIYSLNLSNNNKTMSPPPSSTTRRSLKIGIIGFGRFGQFLAKTMIKQGHTLRATSRSDHSHLCEDLGISYFRDVIKFLEADNDVILICTSILSLQEVLNSMPLHSLKRQRTLFADVLSVKEYPRDVLTKVLPEESDILCTHPMFGPESGKHGWKDLAFVYDKVRVRDEATCSSFLKIFETEGCRMLEMSCEEHDRMAAKSQFLTHTIGRIFSEMEIKSTPMSTKGFETLVRLKDDTTKDSFDLFSGLFLCNRFAKQELKNLELALEKVKQKLLDQMHVEQNLD